MSHIYDGPKDKSEFIAELSDFVKETKCAQNANINRLEYREDAIGEWLYIIVGDGGHSAKKVCITADSRQAIAGAFFNALRDWNSIDYERRF